MFKKIKTLNLSLKITGSLIVVLGLLNLIGSNLLATKGHQLETLTTQTIALEKENTILNNQISQYSSLSYVQSQAEALGFEEINKPIALTPPAPVALLTR